MAESGQRRRKRKPFFVIGEYFDYSLLFVVFFLVCFGLVMIYSTSSYKGNLEMNNPAYWLIKQGQFAILGFVVMLIISRVDYHFYQKFTMLIYFVTIFLLVIVLFVGKDINGARRWIPLGPLAFQPSEIAKIALVLFMAHIVSLSAGKIRKFPVMIRIMLLAMPIVALIAAQNLSTAIVTLCIAGIIVFVASPKYLQFFGIIGAGAASMGFFLIIESYRMDRIKIWLHPEAYDKGYQTMQALYAIGSGGVFGKGLGQSMQKMGFIPESHNDMIFSVICEELGLFGAICVISMFLILIWRLMIIASNAPDLYGALIVVGVMAHIGMQVLINVAVVTNTVPPTGIPLPFISYGGTSLVFLLVEMGIVMSVSRQIKMKH